MAGLRESIQHQPYLRIHRGQPHPGIEECTVVGEVDMATAPLLREALRQAVDEHTELVLVDLSQVALFSAAGVHVLCAADEQARAVGGRFVVVATGPARRVLEITKVDQRIPCYRCRCEAVQANSPTTIDSWPLRCHMELYEDIDPAGSDLRSYVYRIAAGLGLGPESAWYEVADQSTAYLALSDRLADAPGQDVALIWDDTHGWAIGTESGAGAELRVRARYGDDPLPAPEDVVAFTKSVLAGQPGA
jgi:anti-anti-sigma factor